MAEAPVAEGQAPAFGEDEAVDAPPEAFVLDATLVNHSESGGSASGGTKAFIKFEIHDEDLAQLILAKAIGQRAFDTTFAKTDFGQGLTIASYSGRPDEDGAGRAWIVMAVPENQQVKLATIHSRHLTKKGGKLVLAPNQMVLDEVLTKRAD